MTTLPQPELSPMPDTVYWRVDSAYRLVLPVTGDEIAIRPGYTTDGASIPRLFWRVIGHPFSPSYLAAALVHDALYQAELYRRDVCDDIFRALLKQNGRIASRRAWILYRAVRWFGGFVWRRHTPATVKWARNFVDLSTVPPSAVQAPSSTSGANPKTSPDGGASP